jgi:acyl-CoA reductase-like NAD-dependent aldehyde dehydrogenase
MLSGHPGASGLSFTGSVPTGRLVNETASRTFKKVVLEMGGKSPTIVFADADLEIAARAAIWSVFANTGQACSAGTRLLVEAGVGEEFTARITELASRVRVGDPLDPSVHIGPIASQQQYERVNLYVEAGRADANLRLGGGRPKSAPKSGYTSSQPSSRAWRRLLRSRVRRSSDQCWP